MGKVYDNWGRLVKAVQRRENDKKLAMCHSRDHSFHSDDGLCDTVMFSSFQTNFIGLEDYDIAPPLDPIATTRLKDEFQNATSSTLSGVDFVSSDDVYNLRCIAERAIAEGYLREYIQVYASVRKSFIDASFRKLNLKRLVTDIIQLETLAPNVDCWIMVVKTCVRVLFASERRLCKRIFEGLGNSVSTGDECFIEIVKVPAIQLFSFADGVSTITLSCDKLFMILDLRDSLSDLLPDIESVFESESGEPIRVWVVKILSRLSEAGKEIVLEFENLVLGDPSIVPGPGGSVHPMTRYVMNYLVEISNYKLTLLELIVSKPSTVFSKYSGDPIMYQSEFEGDGSTLALHLIWIMVLVQFNLFKKSNLYKDDSLACFFMMNNIHYILQKIKITPKLMEMIGDDYQRSLIEKLRSAATYYQKSTWLRLLHCLRDESIHVSGDVSSRVSKSALKERLTSFNAIFEEVRTAQAMWQIPDTHLREDLRFSIVEKLIPAYRSFCGRFRGHIENGRNFKKYIKYSIEDLEKSLNEDFFEGSPASQHLEKKSKRNESN